MYKEVVLLNHSGEYVNLHLVKMSSYAIFKLWICIKNINFSKLLYNNILGIQAFDFL